MKGQVISRTKFLIHFVQFSYNNQMGPLPLHQKCNMSPNCFCVQYKACKGRVMVPKWMNCQESSRGEGGSKCDNCRSKNLYIDILQIFDLYTGLFRTFSKKKQYQFPKMRDGDQRPFGTFPTIRPFW